MKPRGLVVFDLDGTLLRGPTVCEVLAVPLGRLDEMREFERLSTDDQEGIARMRAEIARWYAEVSREQLLDSLNAVEWAPGVREGIVRLREASIEVAIASITWKAAVDWCAAKLGVTRTLGTAHEDDSCIEHVWPRTRPCGFGNCRPRWRFRASERQASVIRRVTFRCCRPPASGCLWDSSRRLGWSACICLPPESMRWRAPFSNDGIWGGTIQQQAKSYVKKHRRELVTAADHNGCYRRTRRPRKRTGPGGSQPQGTSLLPDVCVGGGCRHLGGKPLLKSNPIDRQRRSREWPNITVLMATRRAQNGQISLAKMAN